MPLDRFSWQSTFVLWALLLSMGTPQAAFANTTAQLGVTSTTVPYLDAAKSEDGNTSSTGLAFRINGTEYMRMTATGSFGIATSTPSTDLEVNDTDSALLWEVTLRNFNNSATSGFGAGIRFKNSNDSSTDELNKWAGIAGVADATYSTSTGLAFYTGKTSSSAAPREVMRLTGTGYLGIGTTSPVSALDVAGGAKIANDTSSCTSTKAGTLKYSGGSFYGCDGSTWAALSLGSSASGSNNVQTANYTLALSDAGNFVQMNCSSSCTLTVPPNTSVAFPTGTEISLMQYGAGSLTVAAGSGVTIRSVSSLVLSGQYAVGGLKKLATNEWVAFGGFQ